MKALAHSKKENRVRVHEPKALRFFTGRAEPVSDWPEKLIAEYIKDFGEDQ